MKDNTIRVGDRIVPDVPGWWWRSISARAFCVEVTGDGERAIRWLWVGQQYPVNDDGYWLAPIPGPEVCAALAEYAAALADWDALPPDAEDNRQPSMGYCGVALNAAIRADRDGAA